MDRSPVTAAARESETQFRSFFESMDQGCILTDVILDEHGVPVDLLYVEANSAAVRMTGMEGSRRVAAVNQDVTLRKQADAALRANADQLRRGLATIQEDERRRIARDIHDHLGQEVTALRLNLEALRLRIDAYPALAEQVVQVR